MTHFELHPYGSPLMVGGLTFDLPTFTDPEHARYVGVLVTRLFLAARSERATVEMSIVEGLGAVTDCLWRVAMQGDGICPLLAGLLVLRGVPWSCRGATPTVESSRPSMLPFSPRRGGARATLRSTSRRAWSPL